MSRWRLAAAILAVASAGEGSDAHPKISLTSDARVVAGGPATLRFRVEDPVAELAAGDTIEIRFPTCAPWPFTAWANPQVDHASEPGYVTVRGPARVEIADFPSVPVCRGIPVRLVSKHPKVLRVVVKAPLQKSDAIEVAYGDPGIDPGGIARAQRFPENAAPWTVFLRKAGAGREPTVEDAVALPALALEVHRAAPRRLHLSGPSQARSNEAFEVRFAALDTLGFAALPFPEGVSLHAVHESGRKAGPAGAPSEGGADPSVRTAPIRLDEPGIWWIEASHEPEGSGSSELSIPWALPIRIDDAEAGAGTHRRLVFGDLHWHSNRSDGSRSLREGYAYGRDVVGLDFAGATDHDIHYIYDCVEDEEWGDIESIAAEMESPGRFAALLGWEYTASAGHWVVLFRGSTGSYRPAARFPTPEDLWSALVPGEAVTIMAHPAGGAIVPHTSTDAFDARFVRASEIFSLHGCAESPQSPHRAGRQDRAVEETKTRNTVQDLLARGNSFAFVAATDNHTATPGNPVRHTRRDIVASSGLCAAWVDSLARENVFDAIVRGDVYATTGPRIRIEAKLAGAVLTGLVAAARDLEMVEVVGVRRGEEIPFPAIHSIPVQGRLARFQWTLSDSLRDRLDSIYLRVVQTDQEMAWSSPIAIPRDPEERR